MTRVPIAMAFGLAALVLAPGAAQAQANKAPPAIKQPTQQELQLAIGNFSVLMGALRAEQIPQAVKSVLFMCIYTNPFAKIHEGTEKVLAERKATRTPDNVAGAMAAVCGLKPEMLKQQPPAPKKK